MKPDLYYNVLKYTKKYGAENAAEFSRFEAANILAVKALVEKENIDCDFILTRAVDIYVNPDHAKECEANYQELRRIGIAPLGDVHYLGKKDAERVSLSTSTQYLFTKSNVGLWCKRSLLCFLFYCGIYLALQIGDAPFVTCY